MGCPNECSWYNSAESIRSFSLKFCGIGKPTTILKCMVDINE